MFSHFFIQPMAASISSPMGVPLTGHRVESLMVPNLVDRIPVRALGPAGEEAVPEICFQAAVSSVWSKAKEARGLVFQICPVGLEGATLVQSISVLEM